MCPSVSLVEAIAIIGGVYLREDIDELEMRERNDYLSQQVYPQARTLCRNALALS